MTRYQRGFLPALMLAALSASTLAADPTASKYYEDAKARYDKQDVAGAIIQLKNALKTDPNMLAAHVLLGKALLTEGDPVGAEVEFDTALRLGVSPIEVLVLLGRSLLSQGKYDVLLERITPGGLPPATRVEVLVLRASAEADSGRPNTALQGLDEARAIDPNSVAVRLAQATILIRKGDLGQATKVTDEAITLAPEDAEAWNTRASILHLKDDVKGALAAYGKAASLKPKYFDPRIARAGLLIDMGRMEEAERQVAEILAIEEREPRANYLKAVLAGSRGDQQAVKVLLESVVQVLDLANPGILARNRQMLLLSGLAHYELGNQEKALEKLSSYLHRFPGEPGPSKVLASIHLDRGDHASARSLLEPLLRLTPNDPRAMSLLASAYMKEGNFRRASELLDQAVQVSGGAADIRTEFGLSLIGTGKAESGIEQLKQVFDRDPKQIRAGIALTMLYLRTGRPKPALDVIQKIVKVDPGNLAALNLLGFTQVAAMDRVNGRKTFEQVLAKDAGNQAASLHLARLDVAEGKVDAGRQRLTQLIKGDIRNIEAMMALAALEDGARNQTEAMRWLERARAEPKGRLRAGLALGDLYLRSRNPESALSVTKETLAIEPENLAVLGLLARVQLAKGDGKGAQQTLRDMTRYANYDPAAQFEIARLQVAAGNDSGATYSLDKALDTKPDFMPALALYAEIEIARKAYAKAEQRIQTLAGKHPSSVLVPRLRGDLALARGQRGQALAAYGEALRQDDNADIALRVFATHAAAGELAKGVGFLEKWHRDHAGELGILRTIGDAHLSMGHLKEARAAYERILKARPDDALILNNVAVIAQRQGDKGAVTLAEQAHNLRPNDPVVIDTLGWILVQQGQVDRGLGLLRDARLRDPGSGEIRYHLAVALSRSGRRSEAKAELSEALKTGITFEGIEEARRLEKELAM